MNSSDVVSTNANKLSWSPPPVSNVCENVNNMIVYMIIVLIVVNLLTCVVHVRTRRV